ncbi:PSP1 domain-containing protein [Desulfomonile tiedjei]|uniref:Putative PSP1-like protein n=1 Tax=Desulfomonile tiedjei (strain ATCC 49306 / DSM 6799 / DCB-1) TaxID=706587 RepID=I4CD40_DESTA|nr:stage 0 sporulation family protein [Desulfomonile tiedjei]AFM27481.1 putative PSP1-like protein [Desulfomonile tiedjei DSM 6799]
MSTDKSKKDISYLPRSWGSAGFKEKNHKEVEEPAIEEPKIEEHVDYKVSESEEIEKTEETISESTEAKRCCADRRCPRMGAVPDQLEEDFEEPHPTGAWEQSDPTKTLVRIVGVRFGYASKIYHFDCGDMNLSAGDWVVVKTEKGLGLGLIALPPFEREFDAVQLEGLRKILRKACPSDFEQKDRCREKEYEAYMYCLEKIETLDLPMKLVSVECFFDCSKYVFYFTAEGRVDFRELVKLLVARFPVRIEMRQIGVRHEAKMTGGLACCGQELCCARFLTDFRPVSVRMAKTQNLSLNPTKISGVCGRLMCCLAYEHDVYEEFKKGLPRVGKAVTTSQGEGLVLKHNPLAETVFVKLQDETIVEVNKSEIVKVGSSSSKKGETDPDGSNEAENIAHKGETGSELDW